jgi:hypothetical protein
MKRKAPPRDDLGLREPAFRQVLPARGQELIESVANRLHKTLTRAGQTLTQRLAIATYRVKEPGSVRRSADDLLAGL